MFKKNILKNGLRIITVPMKGSETVTFLVLVGTGSKYETKDINGISHFLEHMFFKGTKNRPDTLTIAETLDRVGGEYNAFTSKEFTGFWAKVAAKNQDVALDWISDILLNSKFDADDLEREKGVITEEINMYFDTPSAYVGDLWDQLLYGDQPAGRKVIGEKENIAQMSREKIISYFRDHYSSSNTIICVAGGINPKTVLGKVGNRFKTINSGDTRPKVKVKEEQANPRSLVYFKQTDQTHLCLGVRAYDIFHPQRYALGLLATILGGNMSSRLFIEVREKRGLAYYVRTAVDATTDTGALVTSAGVDNKNVEAAIKAILGEYKSLKEKTITKEELQKAKDYQKGGLSLSLESSDNQASFYADQELLKNEILAKEEISRRIDKVTANDIKKVAEDIFKPEKLNLALIGPYKEKERFDKLLEL